MAMTLMPNFSSAAPGAERFLLEANPVLDGGQRRLTATRELAPAQGFLRTVLIGSASMAMAMPGYVGYLPHVGTSPSVHDRRFSARPADTHSVASGTREALQHQLTLSVADQLREISACLSLNKSQLAEVLGVSRPTLYDWLDGKEPNATNTERLTNILRLLAAAGVSGSLPLNARFVRHALGAQRGSLLDALRAEVLDEPRIAALLGEAKALGEQAETQRTGREAHLRRLGFEEPSPEQRKEQLARNVAMRDWPKE